MSDSTTRSKEDSDRHPIFDATLRAEIHGNLSRFERLPLPTAGLRLAAVALVLIADEEGRGCFLITRRASHLRRHAGQWALPGGRLDPGENALDAALRETHEEVGLDLGPETLLGRLDDFRTRSGFVISPLVFWGGEHRDLTPDPTEVAKVYRVPLTELEKPGVPNLRAIPESDQPLISISMLGANIHAPTAAILYQLREVALAGRSTRVSHFEQPRFAWK